MDLFRNTICHGNALDVLRSMPDESIQCCVTSPPYWGLRDYGVPGQLGLEKTPEEYVAKIVEIFREVWRILRKDGTLWLNLADKYKSKNLVGIPWRVAFALQEDGWYLRSDIIWNKPNPMPEAVTDRPTKAHEYLFLLTKSERYFYDQVAVMEAVKPVSLKREKYGWKQAFLGRHRGSPIEKRPYCDDHAGFTNGNGRNIRSVWTIVTKPFAGAHFATFPPALAERCVKAGTSEKGSCPKCGTPWKRITERTFKPRSDVSIEKGIRGATEHIATGWTPTCSCDLDPIPCIVLDPFFGAGTVGMVAKELGRDYVGIELNREYIELAEKRIKEWKTKKVKHAPQKTSQKNIKLFPDLPLFTDLKSNVQA